MSAAVYLASKSPPDRIHVTLFEAAPKLGGRAYAFFDKNINGYIDNGQHILASWFTNTIEFLDIIGTRSRLYFQERLEVNFADLNGRRYRLKCPNVSPPLHLILGIMRYGALRLRDKLGIIRFMRAVKKDSFREDYLRTINADELFKQTNQSANLIARFWRPFIAAVFNAEPDETSAWLFVEMIRMGFLTKGNSNLVLPGSNLNETYVNAAGDYLQKNEADIRCSTRVLRFNFDGNRVAGLETDRQEKLSFDYYISAVPFFEYGDLLGDKNFDNLIPSPIINIHHVFEDKLDKIFSDRFIGILNATIQWIFKTGENSICVVISSAKDLIDKDKDELISISINEICRAIPGFKKAKIGYSRVVKEKRATFVPNADSMNSRPDNTTKYKNFFIAGDWTNTGYPSTLEGAVISGKKCAEIILSRLN